MRSRSSARPSTRRGRPSTSRPTSASSRASASGAPSAKRRRTATRLPNKEKSLASIPAMRTPAARSTSISLGSKSTMTASVQRGPRSETRYCTPSACSVLKFHEFNYGTQHEYLVQSSTCLAILEYNERHRELKVGMVLRADRPVKTISAAWRLWKNHENAIPKYSVQDMQATGEEIRKIKSCDNKMGCVSIFLLCALQRALATLPRRVTVLLEAWEIPGWEGGLVKKYGAIGFHPTGKRYERLSEHAEISVARL